jgi:hypothetical protein
MGFQREPIGFALFFVVGDAVSAMRYFMGVN